MIPEIGDISKARDKVMAEPLADTAPEQRKNTAADWRENIDRVVMEAGADMVGIARFDPAWVYDSKKIPAFKTASIRWRPLITRIAALQKHPFNKPPGPHYGN